MGCRSQKSCEVGPVVCGELHLPLHYQIIKNQ